ncbi:MAG: DHH family phosphoesterase [Actinomycetia bacterium]|nr:DHH family phosphoesterase [Actinomycetes bacterium]
MINLYDNDRVLIIHHWDCDGLCAAALLIKYLSALNSNIEIYTGLGEIGKYYFTSEKIKEFKKLKPGHIIICDFAIPREDILKLKDISNSIYVFDHHEQDEIKEVVHINPLTKKDISGLKYPSAGWVVNEYFRRPQEILAALGAIGDQEEILKKDKRVTDILNKNNLNFDQAQEIVKNIDSSYIINDEKQIKWIVDLLARDKNKIKKLLKNRKLLISRQKIENAIESIIESGYTKDDDRQIIYKKYKSEFHIISNITRELAKKFSDYLIIVINNSKKEDSNIYFRNRKGLNLVPLIELAHNYGFNSGGKKEVVGVILPESSISGFLEEAINILNI